MLFVIEANKTTCLSDRKQPLFSPVLDYHELYKQKVLVKIVVPDQ